MYRQYNREASLLKSLVTKYLDFILLNLQISKGNTISIARMNLKELKIQSSIFHFKLLQKIHYTVFSS